MFIRMAAFSALLVLASSATAFAAPRSQSARKLSGYKVIVVERFTVDKNPATANFPDGLASVVHSRAVQELQAKSLFNAVIEAAPASPNEAASPNGPVDLRIDAAQPPVTGAGAIPPPDNRADSGLRVILHCTVPSFTKGNRAARYLAGFGAGESKLKVRFTLTGAKSGADVMSWEQTGTFKGTFKPFGGSGSSAFNSAANGVVKGLIKQIQRNR